MSFGNSVLFYFLLMYIHDFLAAYTAYLLAGRRMPYRKVYALSLPAAIIQSFVLTLALYLPYSPNLVIDFLLTCLFNISVIFITVVWVCFLFRDTDKKKRFFYSFLVFPITLLADHITNVLMLISPETRGMFYSETPWTIYLILIYYAAYLFVHAGTAVIIRLVSKTDFWNKLQALGNYPKLYIPMGIIYGFFYTTFSFFFFYFAGIESRSWFVLIMNISCLALLGLAVLLVSDVKRTENLNAARSLFNQQQNYINKLESIQREFRSIQHDHKNILSGLYAQASEGNAEAVKEFIDARLLKVNETVSEDLRQMSQLTRIEIPELKGLILTKMLEAESDKVPIRLEVMFPVIRATMTTDDLLRCVGILLDNAIDEAQKQKSAAVTLLLLQEDETLTVVVKNPVRDKPDLTGIQNEGYSTKGSGRGIDLSNYQNIIRKYSNALQETKIEGEYFVQVLVLAGNL